MKHFVSRGMLALLLLWAAGTSTQAAVKPARIFSSNMVLQQGQENPIWGWADKGEKITISFAGKTIAAKAGNDGKWSAKLPSLDYGGPYSMTIKGKNSIQFDNIQIGEVWICSGQSNMEWTVSNTNNAKAEIASANYPNIRLFTVAKKVSQKPVEDLDNGEWVVCNPETAPAFSAVGYFFGRHLNQELKVPVGLIHTSWGGTVAETWTSSQTIENDPDFKGKLQELAGFDMTKYREQKMAAIKAKLKEVPAKDAGLVNGVAVYADQSMNDADWADIDPAKLWEDSGYPPIEGIAWYRKTITLTADQAKQAKEIHLGAIDDNDITWINGMKVGSTKAYNEKRVYAIPSNTLKAGKNVIAIRVEDTGGGGGLYGEAAEKYLAIGDQQLSLSDPWKFKISEAQIGPLEVGPNDYPTLLFNGMLNPIIPYGIKGAIWYQGESNADRAKQYQRVFPSMIQDWRNHWKQGDFGFHFVSLANYMPATQQPGESAWAELREAQTKTLALPNTGMALAIDLGVANDIHPRNKQDVGKRLALSALKTTYGKDIVHSGPMYQSVKIDGNKALISFTETGSGLTTNNKYGYINCFSIAGADRKFVWARATIADDHTVIVYSDEVKNPVAVRFGWANNPDDLNLYNKEGLPANPFRTDDWPGITK
ncbi:MAG: 9-O-acetylesterase [Verrucomicrobia bacterium]|nr:9-O-acetylesterase [Prolixibacteraceae bacterium]